MESVKKLFLTSSILETLPDIIKQLDEPVTGKSLAFISTASEVEGGMRTWIYDDLNFFTGLGFKAFQYTLTDKDYERVKMDLKDVDFLFVAGGNAFYLLDKIHKSNFTQVAKDHLAAGKVYIGESSGTLVTCPDLTIALREEAIEKVPDLKDFSGMNLVDITVFPHWGSDQNRDFYLHHRMERSYQLGHKIILLTDTQYVYLKGDWIKILEVKK